jgi:hypothetical protein
MGFALPRCFFIPPGLLQAHSESDTHRRSDRSTHPTALSVIRICKQNRSGSLNLTVDKTILQSKDRLIIDRSTEGLFEKGAGGFPG